MAYDPTTWTTGDTITEEKMNHLEQGVANEQVGPQGPKGETGPAGADGADGAAAGFGTPTATVDTTSGTPAVTVQATYVPTDWETGDVITATKLNNMETGIAGALQTSGGTVTGDITMSGDVKLIGNASTSNSLYINKIEDNSDFNDFKEPTIYSLDSSKYNLINAPTENLNAGILEVFKTSDNAIVFQIFYEYKNLSSQNTAPNIYIRNYYSTKDWFSAWVKVATESLG